MKSVRNARVEQTSIVFKKQDNRNEGSNNDRNSHYFNDKRRNSSKYATQNNKTTNADVSPRYIPKSNFYPAQKALFDKTNTLANSKIINKSQNNKSLTGINKGVKKTQKCAINDSNYNCKQENIAFKNESNSSKIKKKLLLGVSKKSDMSCPKNKLKISKDSNKTQNLEGLINSIGIQPKTPSCNVSGLPFTSNNAQYTKSPRIVEEKEYKKKYISPRGKRSGKMQKSSQSKSKTTSTNNRKQSEKKHLEYNKHNESTQYKICREFYYGSKRPVGLSDINISVHEIDSKRNKASMK